MIKNADMSEDMQQDAVDCASQALEKYNIEKASKRMFPNQAASRLGVPSAVNRWGVRYGVYQGSRGTANASHFRRLATAASGDVPVPKGEFFCIRLIRIVYKPHQVFAAEASWCAVFGAGSAACAPRAVHA